MNRPDIQQLAAELQGELRLVDWRIEFAYVRDLKTPDGTPAYGLCYRSVDAKQARILIRDPATPITSGDPSVEERLIHELVHLHMAPLAGERPAEIAAEEQAVWAISEAIARRGPRAQMVARAMAAHARSVAPMRMGGLMDPKLIAAALDALIADDKDKCAEILKGLVTASAAGGAPPAPEAPASMAPEGEQPPPPPAMAPPVDEKKPPMAQAAPVAAPRAQEANGVQRAEFDAFRTEQILATGGAHLTATQRAFAAQLGPDQVRTYLATHAPVAAPAVRNMAPTKGGDGSGRASRLPTADKAHLDAQMGLGSGPSPIERQGNAVTFRPMTKGDAARHMAAQNGGSR